MSVVQYFAGAQICNAEIVGQAGYVFEDEDASAFIVQSAFTWDGATLTLNSGIVSGAYADDFDAFISPHRFSSGRNLVSFLDEFTPLSVDLKFRHLDSDEYTNQDGDDDDSYIARGQGDATQPDLGVSHWLMAGISRDSAQAVLPLCQIDLFDSQAKRLVAGVVSNAAGAFAINCFYAGPFYMVGYKVGTPDVAGTTLNTLLAVPQ
jgi:hypothetical protein